MQRIGNNPVVNAPHIGNNPVVNAPRNRAPNMVRVRKEDVNKLVMSFLVTGGYLEAAKLFQEESGTEHIDLATIQDRAAIRKDITDGRAEAAMKKINDLNSKMLDESPQLHFRLQQQRFIEQIRNENGQDEPAALKIAREELGPRVAENPQLCEDLKKTMVLLAFGDVYECPGQESHALLEQSELVKTAREVNMAVLTSNGHEKVSKLEKVLKMQIWTKNKLNEKAPYQFPTYVHNPFQNFTFRGRGPMDT